MPKSAKEQTDPTAYEGYDGKAWMLVDEQTGEPFALPCTREDFRGDPVRVVGGRPPHKPASSGHIYTADGCEYYAGVVNAKWVHWAEA